MKHILYPEHTLQNKNEHRFILNKKDKKIKENENEKINANEGEGTEWIML